MGLRRAQRTDTYPHADSHKRTHIDTCTAHANPHRNPIDLSHTAGFS